MKLYNIFQDIILEEITRELEKLNEGAFEDIAKVMENPVFISFKYETKKGITNRYVRLDKMGTSLAGNKILRLWQVGGGTTKTKKNGKVEGWKTFRIDKIVPGSIKLTNMRFYSPVQSPEPYNATGDKLMIGSIQTVKFKK